MSDINTLYWAYYYDEGSHNIHTSLESDLYTYQAYIWTHDISIEKWDCLFFLSADEKTFFLERWAKNVSIKNFWVLIRGYQNGSKSSSIDATNLPYVNGCSTREIFHPERIWDPTAQLLIIPPHSAEQAHHIHSTVRVAYILSGRGYSIVWMEGAHIQTELRPGMMVVLDKFAPHHFITEDEKLVVLPIHVFSSPWKIENNHPMYNGTYLI